MNVDPCAELRKEFRDFRQSQLVQNRFVCNTMAKPLISNFIGELLLFVVGEQPKTVTPSRWFSRAKNSSGKKISGRVDATERLFSGIVNFKQVANELINKRNRSSHCSSVDELTERVDFAMQAFDAFPELVNTMNNEYSILLSFHQIENQVLSIPL